MDGADDGPFAADVVEASEEEAAEAAGVLDLSEDGFDDLLSEPVSASSPGAPELEGHGGDASACEAALAGEGAGAMTQPSRREVGGDPAPRELHEVGLGAVAGIGGDLARLAAQFALMAAISLGRAGASAGWASRRWATMI